MAELYCSCEQQHPIWAEFWWVGEKYQWVFFDDLHRSEMYTEPLTHCPDCSQRIERMNLVDDAVKAVKR